MRRRISWVSVIILLVTGVLAGCGSKNAESIVKDLDKVVSTMESYQGSGTMILHTGQQPLEYQVEVWYQAPQYYRIALTNAKRDITQIVLRNDEGVFVLTPQLNKSYRFQSEWPDNQGQVYLYQTLVKSILMDNSRQFTTDKDMYVFDVMAGNYQNGSFARQKIQLDKESYAPRHVEVMDTNANVMVEVNFTSFEFGKKMDVSAFDMDKNMSGTSKPSPSPSAENSPSPTGSASPDATSSPDSSASVDDETSGTPDTSGETGNEAAEPSEVPVELPLIEPDVDALPAGVELMDVTDVQLGERQGYMLRYSGAYDFTILEMVSETAAETMSDGIILDLGFTAGHLTDDETRTLTWSYDGVEYRISSMELPDEDMIRIAQAMEQSSGK